MRARFARWRSVVMACWALLTPLTAMARPVPYSERPHPEATRVFSRLCDMGDDDRTVFGFRLVIVASTHRTHRAGQRDWPHPEWVLVQFSHTDRPTLATGGIVGNRVALVWRDQGQLFSLSGVIGRDGAIHGVLTVYPAPDGEGALPTEGTTPQRGEIDLWPERPDARLPRCAP